ncbi:hypothetical protein [Micromonospora sp. DT229]|uniref:hypothetical protein n=1 Tax=Micromonospora sp. DT229 TaxID=3393430 RepID=UPI003CEB4B4D
MSDVREALRAVWDSDPDHYPTGSDPLPGVRARLRRRRRVQTAGAGLALSAVVGIGTFGVMLAERSEAPPTGPASASPTDSASPFAPDLWGLPPYLDRVDATEAVLRSARPQLVPTGIRAAYEGRGPVTRVIVVYDFTAPTGLPGTAREVSAPSGAQVLTTDDSATSTAYLTAWRPDGSSLFLAVTADQVEVRSATIDALIQANLG